MTGIPQTTTTHEADDEAADLGCFVLVPIEGEEGATMTIASDGSYSRWRPTMELDLFV